MSRTTTIPAAGSVETDTASPGSSPPVHSWDEFTQLREVVVGTAVGARLPDPQDVSAWLNLYPDLTRDELRHAPFGAFSERVTAEAEEDLDTLAETLRELDVVVARPDSQDHTTRFGTPDWTSTGMYSYCPRDLTLVLGDLLLECPSPTRARYFESIALHRQFRGYQSAGARWLAAPRPRLADELYSIDEAGRPQLGEIEVAFEAANVLRLGTDILYQISTSGNEAGFRWLRGLAAESGLTVHPLRGLYPYTHIDSTIALLRPGLVLLNPARISQEQLPRIFDRWETIWCPPPALAVADRFPLSSPWISMNLLMVTPDLAIVDAQQPDLHRLLQRHGIEVIPQNMRHQQALGGGVHCVTLDIRRDGERTSYSMSRGRAARTPAARGRGGPLRLRQRAVPPKEESTASAKGCRPRPDIV